MLTTFNETKIISEKQDLTYLNWTRVRHSSGTNGSFLKAFSDLDGEKIYYKLSNYDSRKGIVGHECVNEIIVDRLLSILGIEHLDYSLIHGDVKLNGQIYDTWVCASKDFKKKDERKLPLDTYYQLERKEAEAPLDFCIRMGWGSYIYDMIVLDFLILNRDRHGANIEVLTSSKSKSVRLAPLFDHGLSLVFNSRTKKDLAEIDVLEDKKVQCFVGSESTEENLSLIPKGSEPKLNPLKKSDKDILMDGLDAVIPREWQDKIWEMIWKRWKYYESFCNKR